MGSGRKYIKLMTYAAGMVAVISGFSGATGLHDTVVLEQKNKYVAQTHANLQKYFRYQKYERAESAYRHAMQKEFCHFIEPQRWLDSRGRLSMEHLGKVIREERIQ